MSEPLGPLMVDVEGLTLSDEERHFLCSPAVGAVILFSRNFQDKQQVSELVREIKSLRSPSLLIAVDQEGGRVQRFRDGYFSLPPASHYGLLYQDNPSQAKQLALGAGRIMSTELAEVEVDFSFAPVLDWMNVNSQVIGDRAFAPEVYTIVDLAGAFIDGMNSMGMAATGKHFPGHGGVEADSHLLKPVDHRSLDELENKDLIPYRRLAGRLGGVMTAHVEFPAIEEQLPSFSSFWLQQILRQQIGFEGVIFSDDLSMKGAHGAGNPLQRVEKALQAGCDMALICNDPVSARSVAKELGTRFTANQQRLERMRRKPAALPLDQEIAELQEFLLLLA